MRIDQLTVYHLPFTVRLPFTVLDETYTPDCERIMENAWNPPAGGENGKQKTILKGAKL